MSLWLGVNEHTIAFDSGGTQVVKLREVEWTVKEAEMDAMDQNPGTVSVPITVWPAWRLLTVIITSLVLARSCLR